MPSPPPPANPFGSKNVRTWRYKGLLAELPEETQALSVRLFHLFRADPRHPSLRLHQLKDRRTGQHRPGSYSTSIGMGYRAVFVVDGDTNVWYWVGSHADYDTFTGG